MRDVTETHEALAEAALHFLHLQHLHPHADYVGTPCHAPITKAMAPPSMPHLPLAS